MSSAFVLDPRLAVDSVSLGVWPLCEIRLADDARFPWLILVPQVPDVREVLDLAPPDRTRLWTEMTRACEVLKDVTQAHKMNLGLLGNVVEQLHAHVIARFPSDAAWPGPVWGAGERRPYEASERSALVARLRGALEL